MKRAMMTATVPLNNEKFKINEDPRVNDNQDERKEKV
jgi:hypothetical protein